MAEVTFDPDQIFLIADLAAAVGVTRGGATSWVNSRLAKGMIEQPLFQLQQDGRAIRVWSAEQGQRLIETYTDQRALKSQADQAVLERLTDLNERIKD